MPKMTRERDGESLDQERVKKKAKVEGGSNVENRSHGDDPATPSSNSSPPRNNTADTTQVSADLQQQRGLATGSSLDGIDKVNEEPLQVGVNAEPDPPAPTVSRLQTAQVKKRAPKKAADHFQAPKLPPGWLDCPSMGGCIGRLVPCKVPLGPHFNEAVPEEKRFNPEAAYKMVEERGLRVGLVIDLTNSFRYYNHCEWEDNGVMYAKIQCKGRGESPDAKSVNRFVWLVYSFLRKCPDNRAQILVHCTHGFNRTGFMIVSAMMRLAGSQTVESLIRQFAQKRPPGVYKEEYIQDLFKYYHEQRPSSLHTPPVPDWKGEGEEEEEAEMKPTTRTDMSCTTRKLIHHDDIVGEEVDSEERDECRKLVLASMVGEESGFNRFPGSQPVSLDRTNLPLLKDKRYWVTWKADGTRYMLLLMEFGVYIIDRKFNFRRVQMRIPREFDKEKMSVNNATMHHNTVLDGEMIVDHDPQTGLYTRRYLIYDLMVLNGESLMHMPFKDRFDRIERVLECRIREESAINSRGYEGYHYRYGEEPFRLRRKDFWPLSRAPKVFGMMGALTHECDGLILQAYEDQYVVGTCNELLKWKFAHLNSVDFRMVVNESGGITLLLFKNRREVPLENGKVEFLNGRDPEPFVGKIIECSYNEKTDTWIFLRERVDKSTPNAYHVYEKVLKSIRDDISRDELLVHMNRAYKDNDCYRSDRGRLPL